MQVSDTKEMNSLLAKEIVDIGLLNYEIWSYLPSETRYCVNCVLQRDIERHFQVDDIIRFSEFQEIYALFIVESSDRFKDLLEERFPVHQPTPVLERLFDIPRTNLYPATFVLKLAQIIDREESYYQYRIYSVCL